MKNEYRIEGNELIIVVEQMNGQRHEFKLDVEDFEKLDAVGKKFSIGSGGRLSYKENNKHKYVSHLLLDFPDNRITHFDKDPTNLHKDNLTCWGIRNKHYIIDNILVIEIETKGKTVRALFDAEDKIFLDGLDTSIWVDEKGYVRADAFGQKLRLHRYIMELYHGDDMEGLHVDHVKGVKHDNRKSQLRLLRPEENWTSRHSIQSEVGFPNIRVNNEKYKVVFSKAPRYNQDFYDVLEAIRYVYAVRPLVYKELNGTVASRENMIESLIRNGGHVNEN